MGKKREKRIYTVGAHRKVCPVDQSKIERINFKDVEFLSFFISEKGKINPTRINGVCAKNQQKISKAIKLARNIGLLSFTDGYLSKEGEDSATANDQK